MSSYATFLEQKAHRGADHGFEPLWMPDWLFDFQQEMVGWALRAGRAAIFEDCGLGKTPQSLVWAQNVAEKTNLPVLILAPLAVSAQTVREAEKFGIDVERSRDGAFTSDIAITNYERLHLFDPSAFGGVVLDESSILKNFDGARRTELTRFMRKVPYRLLATATAAPNDYHELGTSSEALGYLGYTDMLHRFFVNNLNNNNGRRFYGEQPKWRFRGHAETPFWRWVVSWARAIRRPSDLGFDDGDFELPPLNVTEHYVDTATHTEGQLFTVPAHTLAEQRTERRRTLDERCEAVAKLLDHDRPALAWCHLNDEADLLERLIPGAVQVSGKDTDEAKEEKFLAFCDGEIRTLVSKPQIGALGLNFQHCAHVAYFPSHSYEAYYQAVRRCWRFGQQSPVQVDLVLTEGERRVVENLTRKSKTADRMFDALVAEMNNAHEIVRPAPVDITKEIPAWL